ncbi:MAG: hypothetical protein ACLP0J_28130 [Solirubrobacteraceae bacterium]|jgi:hypothetical protein
MSLFVVCLDGPLAGESFTVARCPRVVRCVRAADGKADILNEPDDTPRLDEIVHWYQWDGRPAGFMCGRGERNSFRVVHLHYAQSVRELRAPDPINEAAAR